MSRLPFLTFLGLQSRTSNFIRKDTELKKAFNVHFERIGSVKKRLGYSRVGAVIVPGSTTSTSSSSSSMSSSSSSSSTSSTSSTTLP